MVECDYRSEGAGKILSNLFPHDFRLDGIECASMEGFLQSLKFTSDDAADYVRSLAEMEAYRFGQSGNGWKVDQVLHWNGRDYPRLSAEYHDLLTRAYDALMRNPDFCLTLVATGNATLVHSRGKHDPRDTTLTQWEYLYQLYRLRSSAQ